MLTIDDMIGFIEAYVDVRVLREIGEFHREANATHVQALRDKIERVKATKNVEQIEAMTSDLDAYSQLIASTEKSIATLDSKIATAKHDLRFALQVWKDQPTGDQPHGSLPAKP